MATTKRIALTDGSGSHFVPARAKQYEESTHWNGNNHISDATGSQWEHEVLYRTAKGAWILRHWSQWQGSSESYSLIDEGDAYAWLIANGHEVPEAAAARSEV